MQTIVEDRACRLDIDAAAGGVRAAAALSRRCGATTTRSSAKQRLSRSWSKAVLHAAALYASGFAAVARAACRPIR